MSIFKSRKDVKIFAVIIGIILLMLIWTTNVIGFEKDWYNKEYRDYKANPDEYSTADVTIKGFETCTKKNYSGLTFTDRYYTALVDVTYEGGQTETYRIPRNNRDKVGSKVRVAYDKHYDTDYEKMKDADDSDADAIKEAARTESVSYNRYSSILIGVECVFVIAAVLYVIWCSKKEKSKLFFE